MQTSHPFSLSPSRDVAQRLRREIARLERSEQFIHWGVAPFGEPSVDDRLPGGGLAYGQWHEIAGEAREEELPAAATGFVAALLTRHAGDGIIVWALQRDDLHIRGLLAFNLHPEKIIFVRAASDADVLATLETALRTRGIAAVVGEVAQLSLTAGKRLQLACERGGATGFLLRRRLYATAHENDGTAAATRWRIAPAPSETSEPGLGPSRWRVRLERSRGGRQGAWIMETEHATGDVRVVAELADHPMAARHEGDRLTGTGF